MPSEFEIIVYKSAVRREMGVRTVELYDTHSANGDVVTVLEYEIRAPTPEEECAIRESIGRDDEPEVE